MTPMLVATLRAMTPEQRLALAAKAIEWQRMRTEKRERLIREAKARQGRP